MLLFVHMVKKFHIFHGLLSSHETVWANFCYNMVLHKYFKPEMHWGMCPTVSVLTEVVVTTGLQPCHNDTKDLHLLLYILLICWPTNGD